MPPPKKDGAGKKKDKKGGADELGPSDPSVIAKAFELQNEALQRQLAERTERSIASERLTSELRQKVKQMEADALQNERNTFDITAEMTRQYKAMSENLMNKIGSLESEIHRLKDELATARALLEETRREKDAELSRRDEELERMNVKLEDMAAEFGDMLAETLRKMGERVELQHIESASGVPIIRRMEEFAAAGVKP